MARITVEELIKVYGSGDASELAVDDVDLAIEDGEFVTIVGPSGCGKTTTLRCIAGLESPTDGRITIAGEDVTEKPPQRRDLSMVFQDIALYPHMTTRENIAYPLKIEGVPQDERDSKIEEATRTLQIDELLDKMPGELSGGQAQRVSLARAIVRDPAAFLLDEPMSDLDAKLKMEMRKELGKIHRDLGATMVYVTHDQEEAMTLSDKLAVMNDGQIEQIGAPEEVYRNPANTFVAQFIGSPSINLLDVSLETTAPEDVTVSLPSGERITFPYDQSMSDDISTLPGVLVLGFRPRHTRVRPVGQADKGGIPATTVLNEPIGDEVIQYLDGPQGELRAVTATEDAVAEDHEVTVQIQTSGIYLFSRETGRRVVRGQERTTPVVIQ